MSRRVVGLAVAAIGAVLVFVAAAADVIGISSGGWAEMFGKWQIIGTAVGAVVAVAGLVVAFLPRRSATQRRKARSRPTQPIKHHRKR